EEVATETAAPAERAAQSATEEPAGEDAAAEGSEQA
ncbi:MAG: hypothetical protein ACI8Y4_003450, partial [Candidatus Poriferisodalaceae bacterium]